MAWGIGILRSSYESLLLSYGVWEALLPYIIWGQRVVFVCLLLVATVGRRLRLRRKYVEVLDKVFAFAATKLGDETPLEEEVEEDGEGGQEAKEMTSDRVVICPESPQAHPESPDGYFKFQDPLPYLAAGMRAVVSDCVTKSFTSAELRTWNMLSRTKRKRYLRLSPSLTVFWVVGVIIRYLFLFPTRVLVLVLSLANLVVCCIAIGLLPESDFKRRVNARLVTWGFDFVAGSLSVVARFHNPENRPTHGIAVANHTSPIDCMVLATDQCYDMVGQKTGGILGVFMSALSKSSTHIWFERTEVKERARAAQRLREHSQNTRLPPILIFPEGCCVNNTAVMQFKKGSFEMDSIIYPIAIRFDTRYGDAFWYQDTFLQYAVSMMTSWAIVVDVWYLPPMQRGPNESGVAFAQRVKALIAHRGGFVQLAWDGLVKLHTAKQEVWRVKQTQWRQKQQREFARHFEERQHEEEEEEELEEKRDAEEEEKRKSGGEESDEKDTVVEKNKAQSENEGKRKDLEKENTTRPEQEENEIRDSEKEGKKASVENILSLEQEEKERKEDELEKETKDD